MARVALEIDPFAEAKLLVRTKLVKQLGDLGIVVAPEDIEFDIVGDQLNARFSGVVNNAVSRLGLNEIQDEDAWAEDDGDVDYGQPGTAIEPVEAFDEAGLNEDFEVQKELDPVDADEAWLG